ncbi:STAS domain-containing protein [Bacteriovorax sp. Seq25_V]|uniref:STAS domain-containing protein n=1 Tax=Bacteriovorax sp. Seq25_V TaxID=1201288 RepID=UPI00038A2B5A|nr:STAS domain-containing protein [Bacteriovorax sp. Seq25_V]EQC45587.1 hypothetical protein M900_1982 [Bacteriovorax sp. Seq25_V]
MSDKLVINITKNEADLAEFLLQGQIDEDSTFEEILSSKKSTIIIDFNKVTLINSCGVREWINFLEGVKDCSITYKNCPQVVIEQINMVHGFILPNTSIESFYAPYYSEKADDVLKVLLLSSQVVDGKAPKIEQDGEELEFDAIEAQYFQFLKQKG